jgi:FkbM family methyltransferase
MRKVLRSIRKIVWLNSAVGSSLLKCQRILDGLSRVWRIQGTINVTVQGSSIKMYSSCDDPIAESFFYKRPYTESSDLLLFVTLAARLHIVLDVGSFTGIYALLSAKVANTLVYAFEPNPVNYKRLVLNQTISRLHNLKCMPLAVGNETKMIDFSCSSNGTLTDTSSADVEFSKATYGGSIRWRLEQVKQVTLDEFVATEALNKIDLVKIDVEHYEINVFKGLLDTVKIHRPIILCEIFLDDVRKTYFNSFVTNNNYFVYLIIKEGIVRLDDGMQPNYDGLNYLFAPGKTSCVYTSFHSLDTICNEILTNR